MIFRLALSDCRSVVMEVALSRAPRAWPIPTLVVRTGRSNSYGPRASCVHHRAAGHRIAWLGGRVLRGRPALLI